MAHIAAPPVNLSDLLKDVPEGEWVALSKDNRLLAHGTNLMLVRQEAGENACFLRNIREILILHEECT